MHWRGVRVISVRQLLSAQQQPANYEYLRVVHALRKGPNITMVLTVLEIWPCTATGPQQGLRELERDVALTQRLLTREGK